MAVDSKIKKKVSEIWLNFLPGLQPYAQNKLYKIVGPFVIGIELINLPRTENYRPHFVLYSLFKEDLNACLEFPSLMYEFYDKRGLQLNLSYNETDEKLKDYLNIVSKRLEFSFNEDVTFNKINLLVNNVLNELSNKNNSGKRASLYLVKFYATLYLGDQAQMQNVLNEIEKESNSWNLQGFEAWHGKLDIWMQALHEKKNLREQFLKQIDANKLNAKINKLNSSELVK